MKIVFLGPPGVGKGTVAKYIAHKKDVVHISTGSLLRKEVHEGTDLGKEAEAYMDKGDLVPLDLLMHVLRKTLITTPSYILDGFPRSVEQAKALKEIDDMDKVIYFEAPEWLIEERISNRLVCPKDGEIYNLKTRPPKQEGICDKDGATLERREDDKPEAVKERLEVYHEETAPLLEHYEKEGHLVRVDAGDRPLQDIMHDTLAALDQ